MQMKATMNKGRYQLAPKVIPAAIQHMVKMPTTNPNAPPTTSDFSFTTIPLATSAKGTIINAKINIDFQMLAEAWAKNMKPKQNSMATNDEMPTTVQICETIRSE